MSFLDPHPNWSQDPFADSLAMQREASAFGFDWPDAHGVLEKLREETSELGDALQENDHAAVRHELGDMLLALVNIARFFDLEPAVAMREANARFHARFAAMRVLLEQHGRRLDEISLAEMNTAWDIVKSREVRKEK